MVHLNGRALPEAPHSSEINSPSNLYDDLQEITQRQDTRASPRRSRSNAVTRGPKPLLPRSLKEALQLAELLSKSKLTPKGFETPETCLVGILYGIEVGLSPIAALQRMAVIDGRPTIWGDAALALVQSSGLLTSIQEEILEDQTSKTITAYCRVKREGRSEPIIGSFSTEDAIRAHLWQKPGPWTDYPKRMLTMRARAFALRDAFPDVLAGLYIREEFEGSEKRSSAPKSQTPFDDDEWDKAAEQKQLPSIEETEPSSVGEIEDDNAKSKLQIRRAPPPPPPVEKDNADVEVEVGSPSKPSAFNAEASDCDQTEPLDPETLLDLFDGALCCALDLATLEEIVDEFAERLRFLPKDIQELAQRFIDRHYNRVEELDRRDMSPETNPLEKQALPRGLKSVLPHLGLRSQSSPSRRQRKSNRLIRSLASWNARRPVSDSNTRESENTEQQTDPSDETA